MAVSVFVAAIATAVLASTALAQSPRFSDVDAEHDHYTAIEWAAGVELTFGYEDGTFRPDQPLSRRHAVVFVERYYNDVLGTDTAETFTRADMMTILHTIAGSPPTSLPCYDLEADSAAYNSARDLVPALRAVAYAAISEASADDYIARIAVADYVDAAIADGPYSTRSDGHAYYPFPSINEAQAAYNAANLAVSGTGRWTALNLRGWKLSFSVLAEHHPELYDELYADFYDSRVDRYAAFIASYENNPTIADYFANLSLTASAHIAYAATNAFESAHAVDSTVDIDAFFATQAAAWIDFADAATAEAARFMDYAEAISIYYQARGDYFISLAETKSAQADVVSAEAALAAAFWLANDYENWRIALGTVVDYFNAYSGRSVNDAISHAEKSLERVNDLENSIDFDDLVSKTSEIGILARTWYTPRGGFKNVASDASYNLELAHWIASSVEINDWHSALEAAQADASVPRCTG